MACRKPKKRLPEDRIKVLVSALKLNRARLKKQKADPWVIGLATREIDRLTALRA